MLSIDDNKGKMDELEPILEDDTVPNDSQIQDIYGKLNDLTIQINSLYDVMKKFNEDAFQNEFHKMNTKEESTSFIVNYIPTRIYDIYCNVYNGIEEYYGLN